MRCDDGGAPRRLEDTRPAPPHHHLAQRRRAASGETQVAKRGETLRCAQSDSREEGHRRGQDEIHCGPDTLVAHNATSYAALQNSKSRRQRRRRRGTSPRPTVRQRPRQPARPDGTKSRPYEKARRRRRGTSPRPTEQQRQTAKTTVARKLRYYVWQQ